MINSFAKNNGLHRGLSLSLAVVIVKFVSSRGCLQKVSDNALDFSLFCFFALIAVLSGTTSMFDLLQYMLPDTDKKLLQGLSWELFFDSFTVGKLVYSPLA